MRIANRAGAALLASALVVLVFVVIVFRQDAADFAKQDAESERIHKIVDITQAVLSSLKDAETGQRGYLLAGTEDYLVPYDAGILNFRQSVAELRRLAAGDRIAAQVEKVAGVSQDKLDELAYTVALARGGNRPGAILRLQEGAGRRLMDEARKQVAIALDAEEAEFRRSENLVAQTESRTRIEVLFAAALLFLLTLTGTVLLSVEIRYEHRLATNLEVSEKKYRDLAASLEDQVAERTKELRQVNQELSAFAYSVSHDLRAPLRAIDGFSQMVLEDYSSRLDAAGQDMLNRIRNGAKRMGQLIQSLLGLSRVTRHDLRIERLSLTSIAKSVVESLASASPERKVLVDIAPDLAVDADPELIRIVLDNLLSNAWKFTSRVECATIEVGQKDSPNKSISEDKSIYYVRDNGAGFDQAYAGRLFTPFQRLHSESEFEGTGIGLATVQRIVHRHGGRIWAESMPGQGATFYFAL